MTIDDCGAGLLDGRRNGAAQSVGPAAGFTGDDGKAGDPALPRAKAVATTPLGAVVFPAVQGEDYTKRRMAVKNGPVRGFQDDAPVGGEFRRSAGVLR